MKRRNLLLAMSASAATSSQISMAQAVGGFIDAGAAGMAPNINTDQSSALRIALQVANSLGYPLFVPAGTYNISDVELPSNSKIVGVPGGTIFTAAPHDLILSGIEKNQITLENLVFEGTQMGQKNEGFDVLKFEACTTVHIKNCQIRNFGGNGIHLETSSGRVENCNIRNVGQTAIWGQNNFNMLISGNQIADCHNGGIRVMRYENGRDGTIVTDNQISGIGSDWGDGQNGNGINIFRADEVVVANNAITDCALSAIRANSTNNTIIQGNQCTHSQEVGIFSEFAFSGSIISNNIVDDAATGISITNFDDGGRLAICANNIVRNIVPFSPTNPDTTPIGIFAEADTAVTGNIVENVPGVGIGVGWGAFLRNVLVSNNIIRETKFGIAVSVADGAGHAKINDNMIVAASEGAIIGAAWEETISSDLMQDANQYPQIKLDDNSVS